MCSSIRLASANGNKTDSGNARVCQLNVRSAPPGRKPDAIIAAATDLDAPMTKPACPHKRTQLIAKDNDAQYVECLDCGEILEAAEMENAEQGQKKKAPGFDESLSDA
jgi:hypothetical protein